jgi:hypothetical protein
VGFIWSDGFAVPAPAQVTQAVGRILAQKGFPMPYLCSEDLVNWYVTNQNPFDGAVKWEGLMSHDEALAYAQHRMQSDLAAPLSIELLVRAGHKSVAPNKAHIRLPVGGRKSDVSRIRKSKYIRPAKSGSANR